MSTRLDRYILRQLFLTTAQLTLVFAGLITITRSLRLIDFVLTRSRPAAPALA